MGIQGTEVAKESSDIIILDDNFASVVKVFLLFFCLYIFLFISLICILLLYVFLLSYNRWFDGVDLYMPIFRNSFSSSSL